MKNNNTLLIIALAFTFFVGGAIGYFLKKCNVKERVIVDCIQCNEYRTNYCPELLLDTIKGVWHDAKIKEIGQDVKMHNEPDKANKALKRPVVHENKDTKAAYNGLTYSPVLTETHLSTNIDSIIAHYENMLAICYNDSKDNETMRISDVLEINRAYLEATKTRFYGDTLHHELYKLSYNIKTRGELEAFSYNVDVNVPTLQNTIIQKEYERKKNLLLLYLSYHFKNGGGYRDTEIGLKYGRKGFMIGAGYMTKEKAFNVSSGFYIGF